MYKTLISCLLFSQACLLAKPVDILLDEKQAVSVIFSERHHNRISIVDGTIEKIIGNPDFFDIDINDKLGHAFIVLKKPLEKPQALSIVTPSGRVQDLLISSKEVEPTTLFIKEIETSEEEVEPILSLATATTLCEIFEGKEPEGFHRRDLYKDEPISVGEDLIFHIKKVEVFEGPLENIYLLTVRNFRRKPIKISTASLKGSKVNWVFAPKEELLRNEETTIVISQGKD